MSLHDSGAVAKPFGASTDALTLALSPVGRGKLERGAYELVLGERLTE
jgi:hypothetical protein